MKFGKRLLRQLHPAWAAFYVDYRALKQELKQAILFGDLNGLVWGNMLQTELQKVNRFYLEKEAVLVKQLAQIEEIQQLLPTDPLFTQFCRTLEILRYYVVLNYMAIYKITKKRNKMLPNAKLIDFLTILLEQPFYNSIKLARITVKTELLALKILPGETIDEKNFTCPVCLDVLCNPVVLSCAHRFCWNCLSKTSESIQACPVCRKDQHLDPSNFNIDWILKEFLHQKFPDSQSQEPQLPQVARKGLIKQLEQRASNLVSFSTKKEKEEKESEGTKVAECKYTLVKRIGEGVFGEVYLATPKEKPLGERYALKKLSKKHPKFKKVNVLREINAGKLLNHESIIHFFESFETVSSVYIVLEYFEGQDLYSLLEDRNFKPYPDYSARDIFKQLALALAYCHEQGVVHRDIKLENILMDKNGKIRLIDFGLCDRVVDSNNKFKMCVDSVGSPAYIAPEILIGKPYNGFKADVWSCGVVLYSLLFGRFPFSPAQYKHLVNGEALVVQFPECGIPNHVKHLLASMLKLDPMVRASMLDVRNSEWVTPHPVAQVEPTEVPMTWLETLQGIGFDARIAWPDPFFVKIQGESPIRLNKTFFTRKLPSK